MRGGGHLEAFIVFCMFLVENCDCDIVFVQLKIQNLNAFITHLLGVSLVQSDSKLSFIIREHEAGKHIHIILKNQYVLYVYQELIIEHAHCHIN